MNIPTPASLSPRAVPASPRAVPASPPVVRALLPVALLPLGLLLAACTAADGGAGWTFAPLGPTPAASPTPGETDGEPVGTVLELEMTGNLRFAQNGQEVRELRVTAGQDYTVRVTNTANFGHNIWLGPPDRLAAGDTAGLPGLPEFSSGTQEFNWTASPEVEGWEFGCTVPGHYAAGMRGSLVLEGGN